METERLKKQLVLLQVVQIDQMISGTMLIITFCFTHLFVP